MDILQTGTFILIARSDRSVESFQPTYEICDEQHCENKAVYNAETRMLDIYFDLKILDWLLWPTDNRTTVPRCLDIRDDDVEAVLTGSSFDLFRGPQPVGHHPQARYTRIQSFTYDTVGVLISPSRSLGDGRGTRHIHVYIVVKESWDGVTGRTEPITEVIYQCRIEDGVSAFRRANFVRIVLASIRCCLSFRYVLKL